MILVLYYATLLSSLIIGEPIEPIIVLIGFIGRILKCFLYIPCHYFLLRSHSSHEGTFVCGLMQNHCYWGRPHHGIYTQDYILSHFADAILLSTFYFISGMEINISNHKYQVSTYTHTNLLLMSVTNARIWICFVFPIHII